MNNPILNVAFILLITSFFKKQLALDGWKVLLAAFIVALVIAIIPVVNTQWPVVAPWLTPVSDLIILFLTACGSYDFVIGVKTATKPPEPGL